MSNEAVLISIISALLMIIQALVGWIFTNTVKDLKERIARQDERMNVKEETDRQFRHHEFRQTAQLVSTNAGYLQALDKRVEQLWNRIYNGEKK